MDFDRIITSAPINRTAAVVASGSKIDEPDTPLQKRENLVRLVKQIERAIALTIDPARRKMLGKKKFEVQSAINALPRPGVHGEREFSGVIVEVVREWLPKAQFNLIMNEATKRWKAAETARNVAHDEAA